VERRQASACESARCRARKVRRLTTTRLSAFRFLFLVSSLRRAKRRSNPVLRCRSGLLRFARNDEIAESSAQTETKAPPLLRFAFSLRASPSWRPLKLGLGCAASDRHSCRSALSPAGEGCSAHQQQEWGEGLRHRPLTQSCQLKLPRCPLPRGERALSGVAHIERHAPLIG
jgi:hypothetical protein